MLTVSLRTHERLGKESSHERPRDQVERRPGRERERESERARERGVDSNSRQFITRCDVVALYDKFVGTSIQAKGSGIFGSTMVLAVAMRLLGHALHYIITYLGTKVQCYITVPSSVNL